jgi:hypothetical protein
MKFRDFLESELARLAPQCHVTSLKRANIGELVLSDVVLDDCAFGGAHDLDKLRIGVAVRSNRHRAGWGGDCSAAATLSPMNSNGAKHTLAAPRPSTPISRRLPRLPRSTATYARC